MTTSTATNIRINKKAGTVTMSLQEYNRLIMPMYHLKGKAALNLDKLVKNALQAYKEGKTRVIRSLADLD